MGIADAAAEDAVRTSRGGDSLGRRVARGAGIAGAGQVAVLGLRLVSNLVLTHLLDPEAFGLMAVVLAVTTGLQLISDVGVWQAIVRSPRGQDRVFLDTAWTINVVRGVLLFGVGCLAAWPASLFYGRPELLWLLPLCALQALLLGVESTRAACAYRALRVGRIAALELAAQLVGFTVGVVAAHAARSVGALATAAIASTAARVLLGYVFLPGGRDRLRWDREAAREIFSFGRWVFVSTLLFFIGARWDVFALGRFEGMGLLGVYSLAQLVTQVPVQVGERIAGVVLMPALAERFREAPHAFAADVRRARLLLLPAGALLFLGTAMAAPAFFKVYRDAYIDAGWMSQLLVAVGWSAFVHDTSSRALVALGDGRSLAVANGARLVATVTCTWVGFTKGGLVGFTIGAALGSLVGAVVVGQALGMRGVPVLRLDLVATLIFGAVLAVVCAAPRALAGGVGVSWEYLTLAFAPIVLGPLVVWVYRCVGGAYRLPRGSRHGRSAPAGASELGVVGDEVGGALPGYGSGNAP